MIIVLLNFIIAVISETYERVIGDKVIYIYRDKAQLNLEYFQILHHFKVLRSNLQSIKYMVFTISRDVILRENDQCWMGFVDSLKKHISSNN